MSGSDDTKDLYADNPRPQSAGAMTERFGFAQDPLAKYNNGENGWQGHGNQQQYDPQGWGGLGYMVDNNGRFVDGTTGAQRDAAYFRDRGAQSQAPVQIDPRASQFTDQQMGSLGTLAEAARGMAPSQAVLQGQVAQSDALRAGGAGLGAGGLGGSLAALHSAAAGSQGAAAQTMGQRGAEIGQAMGQYSGASGAMRGQAQQVGVAQAQLDANQRALQQQRQEAYEKMAWDTNNAQMQAANESATQRAQQALAQRQQRDAEKQADIQKATDTASTFLGVAHTVSDRRAKEDVHPMGSLGCLMRK